MLLAFNFTDQQSNFAFDYIARPQVLQYFARAAAQKLLVNLGNFARNHYLPGLSQNFTDIGHCLDYPVRSFVEDLRTG